MHEYDGTCTHSRLLALKIRIFMIRPAQHQQLRQVHACGTASSSAAGLTTTPSVRVSSVMRIGSDGSAADIRRRGAVPSVARQVSQQGNCGS